MLTCMDMGERLSDIYELTVTATVAVNMQESILTLIAE